MKAEWNAHSRTLKEAKMRQEGIGTSPGRGGMWHRLFRLPRLAVAAVVLAVAVAVVAVVAGSAQAQTTTTLQLAYNDNGDTIAVPGKRRTSGPINNGEYAWRTMTPGRISNSRVAAEEACSLETTTGSWRV